MQLLGKSIGNYQIKAKLGEGGMGTVFLGEHPLIGKRVAVKVLHEELSSSEEIVSRFFNEAKAVNDIGHQNIVDIADFGKLKSEYGSDLVYFIMEFLDGESLAARLRRTGLSLDETVHVIEQCCSALAASHARGIVHRDLKPENLYLCHRGHDRNFVKILDFGIAKLTGEGMISHRTRTGFVIGTPAYMSPEQCEGKGGIDGRSDIYSLGVVMYELVTGRVPFTGSGFGEILVAHLIKMPERPSELNHDLSPEMEAIVLHAIEKDRNRRFHTMDEFAAALADPKAHLKLYRGGSEPSLAKADPTLVDSEPSALPRLRQTGSVKATPLLGNDKPLGPMTAVGPRSTTLSGAASEVGLELPRKNRTVLTVSAVAVVVALGAFVALRARTSSHDRPTASGRSEPQEGRAADAERARGEGDKSRAATGRQAGGQPSARVIQLRSMPSGAEVWSEDGKDRHGVTPLLMKLDPGVQSLTVELRLAGHRPSRRIIAADEAGPITVSLNEMAATAPEAQLPVKRPGKKERPRPKNDSVLLKPSF